MAQAEFAGDITSGEAWKALAEKADSVLIDVRTAAEWFFVGGPDLSSIDKKIIQIEWQTFPGMVRNESFVNDVLALDIAREKPLYFICRSGVRSRFAAQELAKQGYTTYNVVDGFEGPLTPEGHRTLDGWVAQGLPWRQT